ncbi:molybdate ABC transporter substrate-binding protein [Metaclostridioides mangenotii]|uniref:Molybdate transport system substrate-binding protein n=1 Tax=Metaclostridioides mangenotii TaxID=1540 RepID=A0ABS4ED36_9FIRM|nr:molybdate ABC transporter substrate-binding protein [Clostridioides mangenotii]MBP1855841.1 molybdate transport system substrate-binding protein [Clostridioides mangenotii]
MKRSLGILGLVLTLSLGLVGCSGNDEQKKDDTKDTQSKTEVVELNISAAASLKEAMAEIEKEYAKDNENVKLTVNFGASGSLQQQIEQGAPTDVFISAGKKQMDALDEKDLLIKETNKGLVENDLVLISPKDSKLEGIDGIKNDDVKKIAVGEPESVPAGKYADEVLTNLNVKDQLKDKLVFAKDVKEVLAWVQSGEADAGFVYLSDTVNNDKINVVATTEADTHSPITYPIAVIKDSKKVDEAKKFEDFLLSDKGQTILEKYGYKKIAK